MQILAIDPASRTGWCHTDGRIFEYGVWKLGQSASERPGRLADLIESAFRKLGASVIAFELATFGSRFAYVQAQHNELAGAIRLIAGRLGVPSWGFAPPQWKVRAVGKGNAKIDAVKRGLEAYHRLILTDDDEAAAVAIAIAALQGPPPEPKKKQQRAAERRLKKIQPKLFR